MSSLRLRNIILSEAGPTLEGFQILEFEDLRGHTRGRTVHVQAPSSARVCYWKISQIKSTLSFSVASRCAAMLVMHWSALVDLCTMTSPYLSPAALTYASNCMCKMLLLLLLFSTWVIFVRCHATTCNYSFVTSCSLHNNASFWVICCTLTESQLYFWGCSAAGLHCFREELTGCFFLWIAGRDISGWWCSKNLPVSV